MTRAALVTLLLALTSSIHSVESSEIIRGVNLGGWLLTEPWMTPSLYSNTDARDEWSLCNALGKDKCLSVLQNHWKTFYTRADLVAIQKAGLNSLRIPVGYWAVDLLDYEPYVSGQYTYLIQAVQWARELNLSVLIDVHGHPGSQNGQDNSGLVGPVLFPSNTSNIDRSLNVLRNLTTEFSQHIYGGIVTGIELMNEPRLSSDFSMTQLKSFYSSGSAVVLNASTSWNTTIHDAFWGPSYWAKYSLTNSKPSPAFTLDTHQYYAFAPYNNLPHNDILEHICNVSQILKEHVSSSGIPPTLVGEWSLESGQAPNTSSSSQSNGNDQAKRTWLRLFFEAQLAAYEPNGPGQANIGWTFWSWKQEYEIDTWSYSLGLRDGWIPSDISNMSQRVFPVLDIGCVDAGFKYTAPKHPGRSGSAMTVKTMQWTLWLGMLVSCLYIML